MDDSHAKATTPRSADSADTRPPKSDPPASMSATATPRPVGEPRALPSVTTQSPGRYEIRREQGRGGMGRVLVAFDEHVGREVALKELLAQPGDGRGFEAEAARFLREARLAGNLEHPNIVPVHEVGRSESGALYYTMRLVRGQTLAQALEEAGTLAKRLKRLGSFWDLSNAIAFAHSRGVLHRDIKPQNVMVGEFGETVLLDWGLAKIVGQKDERAEDLRRGVEALQAASGKTIAGSIVGTPAYMSPEQADGQIDDIDERSDVWGLGAVLYEILTGRPPFMADTHAATLAAVALAPLTPVLALSPDAPPDVAAIAEKALQKDKGERYQTAKELAADVEAYMTGGRVRAYRYSSWELLKRFAAENKATVALAAVVLAVIVGALIAVTLSRAAVARESTLAHYRLAQARLEAAELARDDFRYVSAAGLAAESLQNNPANPRGGFYSPGFVAERPDSRGLQVRAASTLYQTRRNQLFDLSATLKAEESLSEVAYSPNGLTIATGGYDGRIRIWDAQKHGLPKVLEGHKDRVYSVAYSPDGKFLASGSRDRRIILWDAVTLAPVRALEGHESLVQHVAFSPDGQMLASASWDHTVRLWEVSTGRVLKVLAHDDHAYIVAFSPDGKLLATGGLDRLVHVWRLPAVEPLITIASFTTEVRALAFSPDSRALAAGGFERAIRIFNPETGTPLQTLETPQGLPGIWSLAYSPNGRYLASAGFDKKVRLWDALSAIPLETIEAHDGTVAGVAFSPNGEQLASVGQDRQLKLWSLRHPDAPMLGGHSSLVRGVRFAPDGQRLASGSSDKTIRIWDISSGQSLMTLAGHGSSVIRIAFSPDGSLLASAARERLAIIWDARQGRALHRLDLPQEAYDVAFSPDGSQLAVVGADKMVQLFDVKTGEPKTTLEGHEAASNAVAFSPDGKQLASGGQDKTIRLWDLATGKVERVLKGHSDWVWSVHYNPGGTQLLSSAKDGLAIVWDPRTGSEIRRLVGHEQWVNQARYSPDGRYIVTSSDDQTARVWDAQTGEQKLILHSTHEVVGVDFSWDSRTVAISDGNTVRLYPVDFSLLDADPVKLLSDARAAGFRGPVEDR